MTPTDRKVISMRSEMKQQMSQESAEAHAKQHPDGCSEWCDDCSARLTCKNGRHEWPHDFSDGDTCYCGALYLIANDVDERPHVIVASEQP